MYIYIYIYRNLKSEHKQLAKEMEAVSATLAGSRSLL